MNDYKLVPVRPTPEMCHAAEAALDDDQSWPAIWEEILDVAPDVQGELDVSALVEALEEGLRAIGDHHAPGDCYATGPMTGDPFRDLVQCPACSFIAMCDDLLAAHRKQGGEV